MFTILTKTWWTRITFRRRRVRIWSNLTNWRFSYGMWSPCFLGSLCLLRHFTLFTSQFLSKCWSSSLYFVWCCNLTSLCLFITWVNCLLALFDDFFFVDFVFFWYYFVFSNFSSWSKYWTMFTGFERSLPQEILRVGGCWTTWTWNLYLIFEFSYAVLSFVNCSDELASILLFIVSFIIT